MDLYGKLHKIVSNGEIRRKDGTLVVGRGGRPMVKMTFILKKKTSTDTPKFVALDTFNEDVIRFITDTAPDTVLKVGFDIESREYQGRWFTSANAYEVEKYVESEYKAPAQTPQAFEPSAKEDDLPF